MVNSTLFSSPFLYSIWLWITLLLSSIFVLGSCKYDTPKDYYPPKHSDIANVVYNKYILLLDSAYRDKNFFLVGLHLANLKAPEDKVFAAVEKGIVDDPNNCFKVYEYFRLYDQHNFMVNLVKADTSRYKQIYINCRNALGKEVFEQYQEEKERQHQLRIDNRPKLDTSRFDTVLIAMLTQIDTDDQIYRTAAAKKGLESDSIDYYWILQKRNDSLNLAKIDRLIANGYPQIEQVGYELTLVPWLVLHHQAEIDTRLKYQDVLQAAADRGELTQGLVDTYNKRTATIQLESSSD